MRLSAAMRRRTLAAATAVATSLTLFAGVQPASADTAPLDPQNPATPVTVSADGLPTVQIDGVAYSQAIVGGRVYVGGKFTKARPAGAALNTQEVTRTHLLAYDLETGQLIPSFAPELNGQVLSVSASPDGTRVYVGGDFNKVDGVTRWRVAAFDAATGALIGNFAPSVDGQVRAVFATNDSVYLGGRFSDVSAAKRDNLAQVRASNGTPTDWVANADYTVNAITVTKDGSKVVAGGRFANLAGGAAYGMGAVSTVTGQLLPWKANEIVRNAGQEAAIQSLYATEDRVYGSGYHFGAGGNLEGVFSADPSDGTIQWIEDCHGDTHSVYSAGDVVYNVGHAHYCGNVGGFPQTSPVWTFYRALAFSKAATGTIGREPHGYFNFEGWPAPNPLNWYPTLDVGSATGQNQGPWHVTGDGRYLVMGGEFKNVNGVPQQGLVRFLIASEAPNKVGPNSNDALTPSVVSFKAGQARVSWLATHDRDNEYLTYKVVRDDNVDAPVYEITQASTFWKRPVLSFTDTNLTPGRTYKYRIWAYDPYGNFARRGSTNVTIVDADHENPYADAIATDGPDSFWPLNETGNTVAYDNIGATDLTVQSGVTRGVAGAVPNDAAYSFDGTSNGNLVTPATVQAPHTFSAEAWIKTGTTSGGKIIGMGNNPTGMSTSYDRHVYMDNAGRIWFGVHPGGVRTVNSSASYNDNQWHHVVATLGPNGMSLYVDGVRVGSRTDVTSGQDFSGYWRIGGDSLSGWTNAPSSAYFAGQIDNVALYSNELTLRQVNAHYSASGRTSPLPPVPTDAYGQAVYSENPSIYWRFDETSGTLAADHGDKGNTGTYRAGYTQGAQGALVGHPSGKAVTFNGSNGLVSANSSVTNPKVYSQEVWFKTTTTNGGKIFGLANTQTGLSSGYDRHLYMETNGRLTFGVWTGQENKTTTPRSYNDGVWHHAVATQSNQGIKLYLDGELVATHPQTAAQDYTGWFRLGGDYTWGPQPWFSGTVDEYAYYTRALDAQTVQNHYVLGTQGSLPNQEPVASFESQWSGRTLTVDASESVDPDGTIASYAWDFGNGSTGTGVTASTAYAAAGTYTVTLTVTDDKGASSQHARTVTVTNLVPAASFQASISKRALTVDASASSDPDGTIASYAWDFGDGNSATGATAAHSYATVGTYTVTLTVTDNEGATAVTTREVVASQNVAPVASFTADLSGRALSVNASASSDSDGTIASYGWDFGDGTTGTGVTASTTYAAAGTYTVTLTVTDDNGGTATSTREVTVTNLPPVAAFTSSTDELVASFDASGSSDPDGTIASYAWDFGDGGTWSGVTASHTYDAAGTYTVTLTVTDNDGTQSVQQAQVTVAEAPVSQDLARDGFGRTLANGWGTADVGGAWTVSGGASSFSVAGGVGAMQVAKGKTVTAALNSVSSTDTELQVRLTPDRVADGGGTYVSVSGRQLGSVGGYAARLRLLADGKVALHAVRSGTPLAGGTVSGLTYQAGTELRLRLQVTGTSPTTIRAKVWAAGGAEPATWQVVTTDATAALQSAGGLDIATYVSGSTTNGPVKVSFDDLWAGPTGSTPGGGDPQPQPNQAPVADFAATVEGLTASVNGSASSDPDGSVASYAWDFGDGTTATGVTAARTYQAAGSYTVTLTVTDDKGATGSTTRTVTVTAPDVPTALAADDFERAVANGWGSAPTGGVWARSGTPADFSVAGGKGLVSVAAGASRSQALSSVSTTEAHLTSKISLDKVADGGGTYVSVVGRQVGNVAYAARIRVLATGAVQLHGLRAGTPVVGGTVSGVSYAPGDELQLRLEVTGTSPTTVRGKIWEVGQAEPAGWGFTFTDTTAALQAPGSVGLEAFVSGSTTNGPVRLGFDDFWVGTSA